MAFWEAWLSLKLSILCHAQDVTHFFVEGIHTVYTIHLGVTYLLFYYNIGYYSIIVLTFNYPSFYLIIAPRWKNNGAGNLNIWERSYKWNEIYQLKVEEN